MTSSVTESTEPSLDNSAPTPVAAAPADGLAQSAQSEGRPASANNNRRGGRRGGRNNSNRSGKPATESAAKQQQQHQQPGEAVTGAAVSRRQHPALLKLQALYPQLFGEQPKPLKRGIFQDLEQAQTGKFEPAELKVALGIHTRSMRYLQAVSQGLPRHDLQGIVVEQMAPEHVFHALVEVFRRRKPRDGEDLTQKLRRRMAMAFEASGLTREAYTELVHSRDDATNALLDEAIAEVAERNARDEALLRAFEASGAASVEAFADMYGMHVRQVAQQLERAKRLRG